MPFQKTKSSAREIALKTRREKALRMRLDGYTLRQIADECGGDAGNWSRYFISYKSASVENLREELYQQQQDRLTELWRAAIESVRKFVPVLDGKGNEVTHPLRDSNGEFVLNEDGTPKIVVMRDDGTRLMAINAASRIVEKLIALYGLNTEHKFGTNANSESSGEFVFRVVRADDGRMRLPTPADLANVIGNPNAGEPLGPGPTLTD